MTSKESVASDTTQIEAFVAAARAARPDEPLQSYLVRSLGSSEAMSEVLLRTVMQGEKTGTFSLGDPPRVGEYYVVTRFDGTPALIWRITQVEIKPFDAITTADTQIEGKALRSDLEAFRKVHLSFWATEFAGKSRQEIGATPVAVQRFVVIYPQISGAGDGT